MTNETQEKQDERPTAVEISLKYISPQLVDQAKQTYRLYDPKIAERMAWHLEYCLERCKDTTLLDYLMQPTTVQEITRAHSELTSEQFGNYLGKLFEPAHAASRERDFEDTIKCAKLSGMSDLEILAIMAKPNITKEELKGLREKDIGAIISLVKPFLTPK